MTATYHAGSTFGHPRVDVSTLAGNAVDMAKDIYTVRTAEGDLEIADLDALVALARSGQIGQATLVRFKKGDWGAAGRIPEVAAVLGRDPWAAWQEHSGDSDELLKAFEQPVEPGPEAPVAPSEPSVEELPASAFSPIDDAMSVPVPAAMAPPASSSPPTVRRPSGSVIEFPKERRHGTDGANALDTWPTSVAVPSAARRTSGIWYGVNWLRLFSLMAVASGIMGTWVWYVFTTSTADFTHKPPKIVKETVTAKPLAVKAPVSPYVELESVLRDSLMEPILDITGEAQFEDALHIELRRVRLDVAWVRVRIESWAGRNKNLPQDVRFQIRLRGKVDELDRDLGALGLVLGKYVQHYGIEAKVIDVLIEDQKGEVSQVRMDPNAARRFFTHRMTLDQFLSQAF